MRSARGWGSRRAPSPRSSSARDALFAPSSRGSSRRAKARGSAASPSLCCSPSGLAAPARAGPRRQRSALAVGGGRRSGSGDCRRCALHDDGGSSAGPRGPSPGPRRACAHGARRVRARLVLPTAQGRVVVGARRASSRRPCAERVASCGSAAACPRRPRATPCGAVNADLAGRHARRPRARQLRAGRAGPDRACHGTPACPGSRARLEPVAAARSCARGGSASRRPARDGAARGDGEPGTSAGRCRHRRAAACAEPRPPRPRRRPGRRPHCSRTTAGHHTTVAGAAVRPPSLRLTNGRGGRRPPRKSRHAPSGGAFSRRAASSPSAPTAALPSSSRADARGRPPRRASPRS